MRDTVPLTKQKIVLRQ